MGSDSTGSRRNEQPPHEVSVDGFWIDEQSVTNAEFRKFVDATGYKTTAERPVDWVELKKSFLRHPQPPDEISSQARSSSRLLRDQWTCAT